MSPPVVRRIVVSSMVLALAACGSDSDSPSDPPLIGTWADTCDRASQGFFRTHVAFTSTSFAVREFSYRDSACTDFTRRSSRVTTGSYTEGGFTSTGAIEIDVEIRSLGEADHDLVLPRAFDLYLIDGNFCSTVTTTPATDRRRAEGPS